MGGLVFLKRFFAMPGQVGSVIPSSRWLSRAMVKQLCPHPDEVLLELGPGTGVFTQALLDHGMPPEKLLLVELDPKFSELLRKRFPRVRVCEADVATLPEILRNEGVGPVRQMLSGLPFRSMPPALRHRIGEAVAKSLAGGGILAQFSYFPVPPLPPEVAEANGMHGKIAQFVTFNFPPAFIWKYHKNSSISGVAQA